MSPSVNRLKHMYIHPEWLSYMENAVAEAEAELSDHPFDSSNEEDEQNDDVLRVFVRQPNTAVVLKHASRQTLLNWLHLHGRNSVYVQLWCVNHLR